MCFDGNARLFRIFYSSDTQTQTHKQYRALSLMMYRCDVDRLRQRRDYNNLVFDEHHRDILSARLLTTDVSEFSGHSSCAV